MRRISIAKQGFALATMLLIGSTGARAATDLITTVNWYNIEAYCSFMRADNVFVYDDPSTWNLVLFTQTAEDGLQTSYVSIDHRLLQLEHLDETESGNGEVRTYRSLDPNAVYDVVLTIKPTKVGTENTDYEGELMVTGPAGTETIGVDGGCGA